MDRYMLPTRLEGWYTEREQRVALENVCVRPQVSWKGKAREKVKKVGTAQRQESTQVWGASYVGHVPAPPSSVPTPEPPSEVSVHVYGRVEPLYSAGSRLCPSVLLCISGCVASWGVFKFMCREGRVLHTERRAPERGQRRCAVENVAPLARVVPKPPERPKHEGCFWEHSAFISKPKQHVVHVSPLIMPESIKQQAAENVPCSPLAAGYSKPGMALFDEPDRFLKETVITMHGMRLDEQLREDLFDILHTMRARRTSVRPSVGLKKPLIRSERKDTAEALILPVPPAKVEVNGEQLETPKPPKAPSPVMLNELLLSDETLIFLTMKVRRWSTAIRARLCEEKREARLQLCEKEWTFKQLQEKFRQWRVESLWRPWNRRRYMRKTWDTWQVYLTSVNDAKLAAIIRLGTALTRVTQWKTFVVWKRYTKVERILETPPVDLFYGEAVLLQWDAWYLEYQKECSLSARTKGFLMRHRCRVCLYALAEHAEEVRFKRKLDDIASNYLQKKNDRLQRWCFDVLIRRVNHGRATELYRSTLTKSIWRCWAEGFERSITMNTLKLHVQCKHSTRLMQRAFRHWVQRKHEENQLKILLTLRSVLFRRKMLFPVYAVMSTVHFRLYKIFRAWSYTVRKHADFMRFVVVTVKGERTRLLRAAFMAWWMKRDMMRCEFDWGGLEAIKATVRNTRTALTLHSAETYIAQLNKTKRNKTKSDAEPDRSIFWEWFIDGQHTKAIVVELLRRLLANNIIKTCIERRVQALQSCNLDSYDISDVDVDPSACTLRRYPITEREVVALKKSIVKSVRETSQGSTKCPRNELLKEVRQYLPQLCSKANEVNVVRFLAWLRANVVSNRMIVLNMDMRDRLLQEGKGEAIPGLEISQYHDMQRKARGIAVLHSRMTINKLVSDRLITKTDMVCLREYRPSPLPEARRLDPYVSPLVVIFQLRDTIKQVNAQHVQLLFTAFSSPVLEVVSDPCVLETLFESKRSSQAAQGLAFQKK
eukprot:TRINITY_DN9442_c10_g1_i1.p1 TRINITY_DN9442_c10_g1~~TRINITY_DN9442_c10_g1_i1.p1  ORF type:complete len:995 (+),score=173.10 TRINITY_DN9442_c10_g1_i1:45-3029(+)